MSTRPAAPPTSEVQRFAAVVPVGRANALTAAELCRRLGYVDAQGEPTESHKRRLRLLARHAVDAEILVCGDDAGYFIPATADEPAEMIARFESQMALMGERLRKVRALIDRQFFADQMKLW